jgi:hypothetical protein
VKIVMLGDFLDFHERRFEDEDGRPTIFYLEHCAPNINGEDEIALFAKLIMEEIVHLIEPGGLPQHDEQDLFPGSCDGEDVGAHL